MFRSLDCNKKRECTEEVRRLARGLPDGSSHFLLILGNYFEKVNKKPYGINIFDVSKTGHDLKMEIAMKEHGPSVSVIAARNKRFNEMMYKDIRRQAFDIEKARNDLYKCCKSFSLSVNKSLSIVEDNMGVVDDIFHFFCQLLKDGADPIQINKGIHGSCTIVFLIKDHFIRFDLNKSNIISKTQDEELLRKVFMNTTERQSRINATASRA